MVFGLVDTDMNDFFKFNTRITSRGHRYKRFTSLNRFRRAIVNVDFSAFTKCF